MKLYHEDILTRVKRADIKVVLPCGGTAMLASWRVRVRACECVCVVLWERVGMEWLAP